MLHGAKQNETTHGPSEPNMENRRMLGLAPRRLDGNDIACAECGYDLRGHTGEQIRCPECGTNLRRVHRPARSSREGPVLRQVNRIIYSVAVITLPCCVLNMFLWGESKLIVFSGCASVVVLGYYYTYLCAVRWQVALLLPFFLLHMSSALAVTLGAGVVKVTWPFTKALFYRAPLLSCALMIGIPVLALAVPLAALLLGAPCWEALYAPIRRRAHRLDGTIKDPAPPPSAYTEDGAGLEDEPKRGGRDGQAGGPV